MGEFTWLLAAFAGYVVYMRWENRHRQLPDKMKVEYAPIFDRQSGLYDGQHKIITDNPPTEHEFRCFANYLAQNPAFPQAAILQSNVPNELTGNRQTCCGAQTCVVQGKPF